jgi:type I restriction enzyme S subunit
MTDGPDLPASWVWATLRDVVVGVDAGKSFTCEPRRARDDEWGVVKVSAMTWGEFRETENKAVPAHRSVDPRHEIRPGDILVSRANTEAYVGAPVLVGACRPKLLLSDKSLRIQPSSSIDRRWLLHVLSSPQVRWEISARATGQQESMRNISQQALLDVPVAIPPLAEQLRIVATLEDHLSRLEAGVELVRHSSRRLYELIKRILVEAVPIPGPSRWKTASVGAAGSVELGRARHPDWHSGPHTRPYLRVANVFEDRIDASDLMTMDFPPKVFDKYRLIPGDILLNEGQSPEYLGRPAIYRGVPEDVAFTNSLLRFKAGPGVDPEWALLVFRRHMHAGRFVKEVRITTNIAHLSATRFKGIEFPIPPLDEQRTIVTETRRRLDYVARMIESTRRAEAQAQSLRRALLSDAFAGRLVPQDPADEPASELLARIRAEREAAAPVKRAPRQRVGRAGDGSGRTRRELAAPPTRVTDDQYEQGELPL